jgi:hypothetical protein
MSGDTGAGPAGVASRRRPLVVAALALAVLVAVAVAFVWRGVAARSDPVQLIRWWAETPTSLVVVYVAPEGATLVRADAQETATTVTLDVRTRSPLNLGGSFAAGAVYLSTAIPLASPLADRDVVGPDGAPLQEGRYTLPLPRVSVGASPYAEPRSG